MNRRSLLATCLIAASLSAQPPKPPETWSGEQLEQNMSGFTKESSAEFLAQVRELLQNQKVAAPAIFDKIHGNHAEYLLRIEKLLSRLDDEQWKNREKAEAALIEIGARGRDLILEHSKRGTIEKRIRAARAIREIEKAGTADEERQIDYIRGLVVVALYMQKHPRLTKALVSSLRHPDSLIIDGAVRALGRHGTDKQVDVLVARLNAEGGKHRDVTLASIASIPGNAALQATLKILREQKLTDPQAMLLVRVLRQRKDAGDALKGLAQHSNPLVQAAAKLQMPATSETAPLRVRLSMSDLSIVEGRFLGMRADTIRIADGAFVVPGEGQETTNSIGMPELMLALGQSDRMSFPDSKLKAPGDKPCKLFLLDGSMITGELVRVGSGNAPIVVQSKFFGKIEVARAKVQGLTIDPKLDRLLGASNKHDKVRLRNGKALAGLIRSVDPEAVEMADGKKLPLSEVGGMLFKRPRQQPTEPRLYTRLWLTTGDKVLCHIAAVTRSHTGIVTEGLGSFVLPNSEITKIEFSVGGGAMWGFTLVADYSDNRVVEYDDQGHEIFALEDMFGVWDVECLENGNLLVTEFSMNRVSEFSRDKKVVWKFEDLKNPYDADRLPNGHTLIADTYGRRVIEVDGKGKIVWKFDNNIQPYDVDRLPNGNTLIVDGSDDRIIEIDKKGNIVWEVKRIVNCHDADRLPNGNTLITIRMANVVREIDPSGKVVMALENLASPSDADRLPNGNTLVAENGQFREFDRHGNEVMRKEVTWAVEVNRY